MELARNPSTNLPRIPRPVAALAVALVVTFGVEVYRNIDHSDKTGCPATADGYDPVSWVAAPAANALDGTSRMSEEVVERECSGE